MNKSIKFILAVLVLSGLLMISPKFHMASTPPRTIQVIHPMHPMGIVSFLNSLGKMESHDNYQAVSASGYLGRYQFSPKTLASLGYTGTMTDFLSDSAVQDSFMILLLKINERILLTEINELSGTMHNGIYITKAGILAGAHEVGPGGVMAYFHPGQYQYPIEDGNHTSIEVYLQRFSKYNLKGM